ncbi:Os08g0141500 [Oryza sativa Japonica Group]|uniref:Os08g0141500 protein n=1 Tax=Oryza sativa subsp. japonica TaxID=39947 RepID=A0A0P0XBU3_ORYSJ|nr:Os08g0141500 [Oryza sativa Japonica Group]
MARPPLLPPPRAYRGRQPPLSSSTAAPASGMKMVRPSRCTVYAVTNMGWRPSIGEQRRDGSEGTLSQGHPPGQPERLARGVVTGRRRHHLEGVLRPAARLAPARTAAGRRRVL